ncbi:MAG: alpha-xylosidase [Azospirillaceae bacterium]|nr:alpha-xylosidase [Azospirillaceae bacterium]
MKFCDGNWLVPENLELWHPIHVHRVEIRGNELLIHAASRDARNRADQLNMLLFTVRVFSPAPGVAGIRIEHFQGGRDDGPAFELVADPATAPTITNDATEARLTTGGLTVRIDKEGPWRLDILRDGRRLTGSGFKAGGYAVERDSRIPHLFERLDLGVGDQVYGLGERFTAFVKNGQSIDIWNRDGGTSTEQAYKNIPFFLTNRGWGVFVNHPGKVSFEIGSERVSKVQFSVPGECLEYYVIDGPHPKQVLDRYTRLTGRPGLPAPWSFGLWLTTSFTTAYDEATVNRFVDGMRERDIPLHVFHFDCFWMRGLHWCDFEWDPEAFPDPEGMLARLKAKGLKICVWINPYIAQQSSLFRDGVDHGYFLKRPDGSVWQWDLWQAGQAIVDFTNPAARLWYAGHLQRLLAMGVDCFKTDFGERIPTDVVYFDGADPVRMHNYYAYLYNKVVFDVLEQARGAGQAVLFARSATVGSQKLPVHWGGDCYSDFESMAESLRGGLSLGLAGFGFWSHDIGGFENTSEAIVYKRWCAFGLLSSHSRLHGSKSYRVPWLFDEEAVDVLRFFTKLKCRLMPYLFATACAAARTGVPMMRAMFLEFPDDPGCEPLDRQYMLGDSLLVAPVFSADGTVLVYLPPGRWTHLLSGAPVNGGGWRREQHDVMSLPLYARPGSLIAWGCQDDRPDYDYAEGATFTLYELDDGGQAVAAIFDPKGDEVVTLTVTRQDQLLTISVLPSARPWTLLLRNVGPVAATAGAVSAVATAEGALLHGTGSAQVTRGH